MRARTQAAALCAVVCAACGTREATSPSSEVSNRPPTDRPDSAALAERANRALAESLRPDYRRPMLETPVDRSRLGELYLAACRAGDRQSCWVATEIHDPKGVAASLVRDNCRSGDLFSCRAIALDKTDIVHEDLPGWAGRSRYCGGDRRSRTVLEAECKAGFPQSCDCVVELDEPPIETRPRDYEVDPAIAAPIVGLARQGCQANILSECWLLMMRAPRRGGHPDDDQLLAHRRICTVAMDLCSRLGDDYRDRGELGKAQEAFERECQFGVFHSCTPAIGGYLVDHQPEPVPHRGEDLANWACQHHEPCWPGVATRQAASPPAP